MQLDFGFHKCVKNPEILDQSREILKMINRIRKTSPERFNKSQAGWVETINLFIVKNNYVTERQCEVLRDIYKSVA